MRGDRIGSVLGAVAVAAVLALSGCGGGSPGAATATLATAAPGDGTSGATPSGVTPSGAAPSVGGSSYPGTVCRGVLRDALTATAGPGRVRLDDAFAPVTAVRCTESRELVPGRGEWDVLVEERATTAIAALVTALRAPDDPPTAQMCTAQLDPDPEVWLLDAGGRAVLPRWPRDSCHHLARPATSALEALRWRPAARVPLRQAVPQAAVDAGCETAWKYLFDLPGAGTHGPGTFADLATATTAHLCRYARSADDPLRGDFESGRLLDTAAWSALRAALEATPPAGPCTGRATRFAVISAAGGGYAEIELDGCHRVVTSGGGLRQAAAPLLALLA